MQIHFYDQLSRYFIKNTHLKLYYANILEDLESGSFARKFEIVELLASRDLLSTVATLCPEFIINALK